MIQEHYLSMGLWWHEDLYSLELLLVHLETLPYICFMQ